MLASLLLSLAAVVLGYSLGGTLAEQANLAARWTARVALPFFLLAFTARAVAMRWPSPATRAILRRRRQWGLAFALAHLVHLAALWFNIVVAAPEPLRQTFAESVVNNLPGGVIFLFIIAMAATSNDGAQRALGKWWRRLHTLGSYAIWIAFMQAYTKRIFTDDLGMQVTGLVFTPLLLLAMGLRWWPVRSQTPA